MIVMLNSAKKPSFPQPQVKWTKTMSPRPQTRIAVSIRIPSEKLQPYPARHRLLNFTTNRPFLRIIVQTSPIPHQGTLLRIHRQFANTGPHFRPMFDRLVATLPCKKTQPMNNLPSTPLRVHQVRFLNIQIFGDHFERMNSFQMFSLIFLQPDIFSIKAFFPFIFCSFVLHGACSFFSHNLANKHN